MIKDYKRRDEKIQKENEQKVGGGGKERMMGDRERERRAKEQLQIKKGYYPEGSIMMCFRVLFCQAGEFDTHMHSRKHTHTYTHTSQGGIGVQCPPVISGHSE